MDSKTARTKLSEARYAATQRMPYLSTALLSLVPVETPGLGTFGTDQYMRLHYDPEMFDKWGMEATAGVIVHEVFHPLLRCHERARAHLGEKAAFWQFRLFNLAQDFVINQMIREANVTMPDDACYPEQFKLPPKLSTEQYYDLLLEQREQENQKIQEFLDQWDIEFEDGGDGEGGQNGQQPGDGDGEGESRPGGTPGGGKGKGKGKPGKGKIKIKAKACGGHCGSCSDGQKHPNEQGEPADDGSGVPGMSDYDQKTLQRIVARAVEEQERKSRGSVPGGLVRMAEEILRPKVDPVREILSQVKYAVNMASGHGDYTWKRFNRRNPPGGCRLPANIRPIPRVGIIADTSGSMDKKDLGLSLGVIVLALKALPSEGVTVIAGDTHAAAVNRVFRPEQVVLAGGGGTDMGAIIVDVDKRKPRFDVIVVCSDGETPWPSQPAEARVVACLTRKSDHYPPPEWMKVIYLEPEQG